MNPSKLLTIETAYHGSVNDTFKEPREIGCYSVDAEKDIHYDDRLLMKYYDKDKSPDLPLDLNVGYENTIKAPYDSHQKHLYNLYHWIKNGKYTSLDGVHFVTTRGTIQKLLCTPYCREKSYHWDIWASKVRGVIYFVGVQKELNTTDEEKRMSYWGLKFEEYMTAGKRGGTPDTTTTTRALENYYTVIKNKLGKFNLLIAAEVDCIESSQHSRLVKGDPSCYVELKTSALISDFRSSSSFKKYKSLRWWAQAVIVGIKETVCGLRDKEGIVRSVLQFKTVDLPFSCEGLWSPDFCFNFCNNFLRYLDKNIPDNPRIVYKFEYAGGSKVSAAKIQDPNDDRFDVLPDWYLANLPTENSEGEETGLNSHSS